MNTSTLKQPGTAASAYSVRRDGAHHFTLQWPAFAQGNIQISATHAPHPLATGQLLCQLTLDASSGGAELELPTAVGAVSFYLQTPDDQTIVLTERLLPFEKVANFRDFGGYHTHSGQRIRWQSLYRSGHLGELTASDQQRIADLDIGLICDFRTASEMQFNPSRLADSHQPRVLELQIDPGNNLSFAERYQASKVDAEAFREAIAEAYRAINRQLVIDNAAAYQTMLKTLLEHPGPVLIHCSAGKDRTGFGAALILSALGVPQATIMEDYLLTNRYINVQKSLAWYAKYLNAELDAAVAAPLFGVQADYLQCAFDTIAQHYGGMDTYIREVMGLSNPELDELSKRYVESDPLSM